MEGREIGKRGQCIDGYESGMIEERLFNEWCQKVK